MFLHPIARNLATLATQVSLLTTIGIATTFAQPTVHSRAAPDREFQLFVGLDVSVELDDRTALIRRTEGGKVILKTSPEASLPIKQLRDYRLDRETKVARHVARISNLKFERGHSVQSDPHTSWLHRQTQLAAHQSQQQAQAQANLAAAARLKSEQQAGRGVLEGSVYAGPVPGESPASDLNAAMDAFEATQTTSAADLRDPTGIPGQNAKDAARSTFDRLRISFDAAYPEEINNAYVVCVARIEDSNGALSDVLMLESIGHLGPEAKKISVSQSRLPPGFQVQVMQVHLYRNGWELATNQSERLMGLTRDELQEFLVLDHVTHHGLESLPARPVWNLAPPALDAVSRQNNQTCEVAITAEGRIAPEQNLDAIPAEVRSVITEMIFLPALSAGKPVAGTARFTLADFSH